MKSIIVEDATHGYLLDQKSSKLKSIDAVIWDMVNRISKLEDENRYLVKRIAKLEKENVGLKNVSK